MIKYRIFIYLYLAVKYSKPRILLLWREPTAVPVIGTSGTSPTVTPVITPEPTPVPTPIPTPSVVSENGTWAYIPFADDSLLKDRKSVV